MTDNKNIELKSGIEAFLEMKRQKEQANEVTETQSATIPEPIEVKTHKSTLETMAEVISLLLTPLIVPTYAIFFALNLEYIAVRSLLSTRIIVTLAVLVFTCILPIIAIAILHRMGKISDTGVTKQNERALPYIITIFGYLAGAIYLSNVNAPQWIAMFLVGAGLAAITSMLVNIKWKISAHGAGMGGVVAMFFTIWNNGYAQHDFLIATSIVILLTGIVGTSRLILNKHTLGQVLAGTLNGFFWVFLMTI